MEVVMLLITYVQKCVIRLKISEVNVKLFNMIKNMIKAKTLVKYISCDCKCKFNSSSCCLNLKWNNDKCQCECKMCCTSKRDFIWKCKTFICKIVRT